MRTPLFKTATVEIDQSPDVYHQVNLQWFRQHLLKALEHIHSHPGAITIALVDDQQMTQLHRDHCGVESITDVLTFPWAPGPAPAGVEIVLCVDEAARRAAEFGHAIERELLLYALHGLLHCVGYDDHDPAGYQAMHAEEDRILQAIGVGATFGIPGGPMENPA